MAEPLDGSAMTRSVYVTACGTLKPWVLVADELGASTAKAETI
jgi:hypothetical protein